MIIEHHKSMGKYYKKHMSKNPIVDFIVYTGITLRCAISILKPMFENSF